MLDSIIHKHAHSNTHAHTLIHYLNQAQHIIRLIFATKNCVVQISI